MSGDNMLSFQDYGPSGAYPSQSQGFGPLPLTAAWAQTVRSQCIKGNNTNPE